MASTALSRLRMLVGEEAFQQAEVQAKSQAECPVAGAPVAGAPGAVSTNANDKWDPVNEEKGMSSDEVGTKEKLPTTRRSHKPLERAAEPLPDAVGRVSSPNIPFCPLIAVKNLAYKFRINTSHTKFSEAKVRFFVDSKFWKRGWTL